LPTNKRDGSVSQELHLASLMNLALGFADVTTVEKVSQDLLKGEQLDVRMRG
jgi:hypothetical protein